MHKLFGLLRWVDDNILKLFVFFYIFFIPLYPKLPLKGINYTYIAIRWEDILIGIMVLVFCIQLVRRKFTLNRTFVLSIGLFWLAIFASFYFTAFIQKTLVYHQLGFLNTARRVEYLIIFFIVGATIRSKRDLYVYLDLLCFVALIVGVYGLGQKFLGWPAVQTMNPAYAKGYLLVLDANARISSTFGGHYDLAAYLVFLMPIVLAMSIIRKNIAYLVIFVIMLTDLILTASRISFGAYVVSVIPFLIVIRKPKLLIFIVIATGIVMVLSGSLTQRLSRTFQQKQVFVNEQTGDSTIAQQITASDLPAGNSSLMIDVHTAQVGTGGTYNIAKLNLKPGDINAVKSKILTDIRKEATLTGKVYTAQQEQLMVDQAFSKLTPVTTILPDISFATRLQVEWPRAVKAFVRYPLFGEGPSTITEATDNNYLRVLGEFGLAGTLTFFAVFTIIAWKGLKTALDAEPNEKILYFGFLFGLFAIMVNATYIDVFEASKDAYHLWLVAGMFMASIPFVIIKKNKNTAHEKN